MVWRRRNRRRRGVEIHPDEILLDVRNLPKFDEQQFEGRMERPLPRGAFTGLVIFFGLVCVFFIGRLGFLQIIKYPVYAQKSEQNSLEHIPIFSDRGLIYDRNGVELAWNSIGTADKPPIREYIDKGGFASLLGYVSYPAKDSKGIFWQTRTIGKDGIEKQFDTDLAGSNGTQLVETDVSGHIISGNTIDPPHQGKNIVLSIDSRLQSVLYDGIKALAEQSGYVGGAGAIMDINTGELIAVTTYPQFDQTAIAQGDHAKIEAMLTDPARPFLFRMTEGLYTPGSIVKPFMSLAALQEGVITPEKQILSTGELKFPNPYAPGTYTIFRDNAAHGWVDMRHALAVSSNQYFFEVGGGFGDQEGLGIDRIDKYMSMFGVGSKTGINISGELEGTIPSIAWKTKRFPGDPWRIGDTYNTSIGQYGFQVTPIQMLRAVAAVASRGTLVTPTTIKLDAGLKPKTAKLPIEDAYYSVVYDGMRMVVTEGTGSALNIPQIAVAAKTGTAQIKGNTRVNSWAIGFFPADHPKYAFTVLMEDGPKVSSGATHAFRPVLDYLVANPDALPLQ